MELGALSRHPALLAQLTLVLLQGCTSSTTLRTFGISRSTLCAPVSVLLDFLARTVPREGKES